MNPNLSEIIITFSVTVKCGQPQHLVSKLSTGAHVRTNIFVLFMFCASHLQY